MSQDKKGYISGEDAVDVDEWQPPAMEDKAINQDAIDRLRRARKLVEKRQQERIKQAQMQVDHPVELRQLPEYDGPQKQFYLDPRTSLTKKAPSAISQLTEEQILQVEAKYQTKADEPIDVAESGAQNLDNKDQGSQVIAEPTDAEKIQAELEQLRQQAHQEGYQAGLTQATEESTKQLESAQQKLQEQTQVIEQLLEQIQHRAKKVDEEVEHEIVTLIKLFVKQIIKREIQLDPTHLVSLLREAIQVLPMSINQTIIVDMHPQEAEIVGKVLHIDAENGAWKIQANPILESGAMRLTMGDSTIDASVERQIQYLISQAFDVRNQPAKKANDKTAVEADKHQDNGAVGHSDIDDNQSAEQQPQDTAAADRDIETSESMLTNDHEVINNVKSGIEIEHIDDELSVSEDEPTKPTDADHD
jgi:flagellar assembly protein FliH